MTNMKITTKTGDKGETSLFGGKCVRKNSPYIEFVGELDELQSLIGWARVASVGHGFSAGVEILNKVQDDLYTMMAIVGFEMKAPKGMEGFGPEELKFLESEIEGRQELVAELKEFIRPGQCEAAARLHVVRAVCRRAERGLVRAELEGGAEILRYLNRLSDLLFILAFELERS